MNISISSIIISLVSTTIFTILITIYLNFDIRRYRLKPGLVYFMAILCLLRLLLPIEFRQTITLPSSHILPFLMEWFDKTIVTFSDWQIQVIDILVLISVVVSFVKLCQLGYNQIRLKQFLKRLDESNDYCNNDISISLNLKNVKIVYCNNLQSPMVAGILEKYILLPDLNYTDKQMRHIIIHELQHIKNFDIYIELLLEILVIIYWWFPPIYLLKRQLDLITEMRVDKQVMDLLDPNEYIDYIETLIFVKRAVLTMEDNFYSDNTVHLPLVKKNKNMLTKRTYNILGNIDYKKTSLLSYLPLAAAFILLPFIIFEPYYIQNEQLTHTVEIKDYQNSYIEIVNGKHYLIVEGKKIGEIEDPNDSVLKGINIVEKDEKK